ncbi:MAG: HNH endonuclease, partial [Candidatus Thermoplasmatota archaeon]|nr:HNH endonuclease [Candidatus Thermoplasmatota archaeon]
HRDDHKCQHCHGKKKDPILQVHHLRGRSEGASNRPDELLTVCKTCHQEHHHGVDVIPVNKKARSFKPETFMSIVRWKLVNQLRELFPDVSVSHTFGYLTKHCRIREGLSKSHGNDAFVIAGGTRRITRCKQIGSKSRRRNNRSIQLNRKGFKPSIRRKRYGLQPGDLVEWDGKECVVNGVFNKGIWVRLMTIVGETLNCNIEKVKLIVYGKGLFKRC